MVEKTKEKARKIIDRNKNGVPDHLEIAWNYSLAASMIIFGFIAFFMRIMSEETLRWILGFAVTITGGRSIVKEFKK
ncbi:MAG: hypothetical protein ACOCRK_06835 [bacterium]